MEQYVPKSQIIKELGGDEDWTYQYVEPLPGENDTLKDLETRDRLLTGREAIVDDYEKSTMDWINGTGDVSALMRKRNELAKTLKADYWRLDPYIRARTYYDRVGLINPGGRLQFYPKAEVPTATGTSKSVGTPADDID